jgi:hypothetical protein
MSIESLAPLLQFYRAAGLAAPVVASIAGDQLPPPARRLLYHDVDMTSTLEKFFGLPIELKVLNKTQDGMTLRRQVVLRLQKSGRPVEFGAIEIDLAQMPKDARGVVLEGVLPLGGILNSFQVRYSSHPSAFFSVESDELMSECFEISSPAILYGRCNTLKYADGSLLAHVVEVLPPLDQLQAESS